ncbi:hypothetical protein Gohar_026668 [Gossypium harknessii]|uniref:Uncharacterized protein n=1 Tax=Gossypium harknessii TaxID=34285 RepID=A0A7J9HS77_9ROSI|nr:hypothetical protein [Gossypium harknessii]
MPTLEYSWWWGKRIKDNIPTSNQEDFRLIKEHLQKIEQLEEEKMRLGLDVDIHKLEAEN